MAYLQESDFIVRIVGTSSLILGTNAAVTGSGGKMGNLASQYGEQGPL
jgi:hypothetical protein